MGIQIHGNRINCATVGAVTNMLWLPVCTVLNCLRSSKEEEGGGVKGKAGGAGVDCAS